MKGKFLHMVCMAFLALTPHLFIQGCSSAPEDDGDLEASDEASGDATGEQGDESSDTASQPAEGSGDSAMAEDSTTNIESQDGSEQLADTAQAADSQVLAGNQTKSDLEEIIAGSNAEAKQAPANDASAATAAPANGAATAANTTQTAPQTAPTSPMIPALPEQGSKMPYVVRVGDTLSSIAKNIYGSAEKWSDIAELSSVKNPNMVRPGDVVFYQLTPETMAFATAYEGTSRNELTIQHGDTLARIAKRVYGQEGDWKYVWRQNAGISDPDHLTVGQTLVYLSPSAFHAAFEFAKSFSLAAIAKTGAKFKSAKNELGSKQKVEKQNTTTQQSETTSSQSSETYSSNGNSLTGFELAKLAFGSIAASFAHAG